MHLGIDDIQYSGPSFAEDQTKAREIKVTFPRPCSEKKEEEPGYDSENQVPGPGPERPIIVLCASASSFKE